MKTKKSSMKEDHHVDNRALGECNFIEDFFYSEQRILLVDSRKTNNGLEKVSIKYNRKGTILQTCQALCN